MSRNGKRKITALYIAVSSFFRGNAAARLGTGNACKRSDICRSRVCRDETRLTRSRKTFETDVCSPLDNTTAAHHQHNKTKREQNEIYTRTNAKEPERFSSPPPSPFPRLFPSFARSLHHVSTLISRGPSLSRAADALFFSLKRYDSLFPASFGLRPPPRVATLAIRQQRR